MSDHHAFLYLHESLSITVLPTNFRTQSVDVQHIITDSFGVSDARALQESAVIRPVSRDTRVFVLVLGSITHEAQNALLKLFEDPPSTAEFHVVLSGVQALLPTLQSRFLTVPTKASIESTPESFTIFMAQAYADRLSTIAANTKAKDVVWIQEIMHGVSIWIHTHSEAHAVRKNVALIDQYIRRRGASKKMLLEELALSLPKG